METERGSDILNFGRVRKLDISQWSPPLKELGFECKRQYEIPPVVGKEPNETDFDVRRLALGITNSVNVLYENALYHPAAYQILDDFSQAMPPNVPRSRVFNGIRIFANLKNMHLPSYPAQRYQFWEDFLTDTLYNEDKRREFLDFIGVTHNSTNVPQRIIGAQFAIAALDPEGMARPYNLLSAGSSLGNDLLTAVHNDPLVPLDVFSDVRMSSRDELTEAKLNRLLQRRFKNFRGVGVDLIDVRNEHDVAVAYAGVYPWELRKKPFDVRQAELAQLNERRQAAVEAGNLRFVIGDFCELETLVAPDDPLVRPGHFDATLFSTMLNQLSLAQQIRAMKVAEVFTKKGGLILVQDFARPKPDQAAEEVGSIEELNVIPPTSDADFPYGLWAKKAGGDSVFKKLLSFRSGRALQAVLTPYGKEQLEYATSAR